MPLKTPTDGAAWPRLVMMAWLLVAAPAMAEPVVVEVPPTVVGATPDLIGYNMGENFPGSGVSYWLEYAGMNAARFWWPHDAWAERPRAGRDAPDSEEAMRAEQAALRSDPMAVSRAHEAVVAKYFGEVPAGTVGQVFSLSELRRLGVTVLSPINHRPREWPFDRADGSPDWFQRWSYWRGVYLNAFYLARFYDVHRFQLFNEPDHRHSLPLTQDEFLRRLQVGSDAVRAAIEDVNRLTGKNLVARLSAPVSAGIEVYLPRSDRPDTRDLERGWGQMIMRARADEYPARAVPGAPLFDDYAIQFYSRNANYALGGITRLRAAMMEDTGGHPPRIIASEMNVSTAANFAKTELTLDSPEYYGAWGRLAIEAMQADLREIYVFRLTQTANLGGGQVKKNGTHIIDLQDPLNPITRLTRGGAVARLFMQTMTGARERMVPPPGLPEPIAAQAARDPKSGEVTMLIANPGTEKVSLDLRWTQWPELNGARVEVAEVSTLAHGGLTGLETLGPDGSLWLDLEPAANLALRLVPNPAALSEGPSYELAADGRWPVSGPAPTYVRVVTARTEAPAILRVWQDDSDGRAVRILGHVVTTGRPQWLRTDGVAPGARLRVETEAGRAAVGLVTAVVPLR